MTGGLKKTSLYALAGVSAFSIFMASVPAANAEYITRAEFEAFKKSQPKVEWKGAPKISSHDGKYSFKVRGRFMGDYNTIDQDFLITGEEDINAFEARRARLGVEGHIWYDWKYKFEIDFAGGNEAEVKDAYIAYAGLFPEYDFEILIGQFKVANSLEDMTSSRYITFMERAAFIDAFGIDRALGIGIHAGGDHWSFQTSYNGANIEDQGGFDDDPNIFAIRGTVAPINNDTTVLHIGGSYRHRNAGSTGGVADLFRYRARGADLHLADRFIATPRFGEADDYFGLEGAFVWNRFSVQGEYAELSVDIPRTIANASPNYEGYYIEGSIFLTDAMRNYDADSGEFKRVKVRNPVFGGSGGWGEWQIAGKYDVINLADGAMNVNASTTPGAVTCVDCGDQETWLIGLNWYLTNYTMLKFNLTESEISGGANDGATISGFGMRAQIDW